MKIKELYASIRPILKRAGVLSFARLIASPKLRASVAEKIGLGEYTPPDKLEEAKALHEPYRGAVHFNGVNYVADMRADIGIGESSRLIFKAMEAANIPVNYQEIVITTVKRTTPAPPAVTSDNLYNVSVVHLNAPELSYATTYYPASFTGRYTIAVWMWEVPRFPEAWFSAFSMFDEIWTSSTYTQGILSQVSPVPVVYIPLPVVVPISDGTRKTFGLPEDRFIFFFSFNPSSSVARKNPHGVIEAYRRAFSNMENPPLLVIKAHHLDDPTNEKVAGPIREAVRSVGGILIEDNLTRLQMNDLMNCCDCFVSLHRAEGFGLGIAEAMALGKPVIATDYSANTDFMTPSNSFGVGYTLRPITAEDHEDQPLLGVVYQAVEGQYWADPNIDQAAEWMQYVFKNPEKARERGRQAQADLKARWSYEAIGERISARLERLKTREV